MWPVLCWEDLAESGRPSFFLSASCLAYQTFFLSEEGVLSSEGTLPDISRVFRVPGEQKTETTQAEDERMPI